MRVLTHAGTVSLVTLLGLPLMPALARACSGLECTPSVYFPSSGTVPANMPGFYFWPSGTGALDSERRDPAELVALVKLARVDGAAPEFLEIELRDAEGSWSNPPYVVVPKAALVPGGSYVLWDATRSCRDVPHQMVYALDYDPGTSLAGRGRERVFANCADSASRHNADEGVSEGSHHAQIRAGIPGTDLELSTDAVELELSCRQPAAAGRDATRSMTDAGHDSLTPEPSSADGGCNTTHAATGALPLALAFALSLVAVRECAASTEGVNGPSQEGFRRRFARDRRRAGAR